MMSSYCILPVSSVGWALALVIYLDSILHSTRSVLLFPSSPSLTTAALDCCNNYRSLGASNYRYVRCALYAKYMYIVRPWLDWLDHNFEISSDIQWAPSSSISLNMFLLERLILNVPSSTSLVYHCISWDHACKIWRRIKMKTIAVKHLKSRIFKV